MPAVTDYLICVGKTEAIARLRALEPQLRSLGADAAYLFGSTLRGNERADSDVDVLLSVRKGVSFTLLDIAAARRLLSKGLSVNIDVSTLADLSPHVGESILAESTRIY